jgi:alkyl hydroperoxide reductase subunit AhpC
MLFTPDITRVCKFEFEYEDKKLTELQYKIMTIVMFSTNSKFSSFLTDNELLLIEMLKSIDYEAVESSKELCEKINTLHRFMISLR